MRIRLHCLALLIASSQGLLGGISAIPRGAGRHAESSLTEAVVTGRVTEKGRPIKRGQVIFDPANINRRSAPARTAEIRPDLTQEIKMLNGQNRVTLAIPGRVTKGASPSVQKVFDVKPEGSSLDIETP